MKKIISFILVVLVITFTGCNNLNKQNSNQPKTSQIQSSLNNVLDLVSDKITINKDFTLVDEGSVEYNGKEYFCVSAGVSTKEKFTAEKHYYITKDLKVIYEYDIINDSLTEVWKA